MDTITYIERGGVVALLCLILYTGIKQVWVFGWLYRQVLSERDGWKDLAMHGADVIDEAASQK